MHSGLLYPLRTSFIICRRIYGKVGGGVHVAQSDRRVEPRQDTKESVKTKEKYIIKCMILHSLDIFRRIFFPWQGGVFIRTTSALLTDFNNLI